MADSVKDTFGLQPTTTPIRHTSKLSNPMYCYTNYHPCPPPGEEGEGEGQYHLGDRMMVEEEEGSSPFKGLIE